MKYATNSPVEIESRDKKSRTVTLTNDDWNKLTTYLLVSTKYRTGERDTWRKLATETLSDGAPSFQHAASNAEYWDRMIETIDRIMAAIDER